SNYELQILSCQTFLVNSKKKLEASLEAIDLRLSTLAATNSPLPEEIGKVTAALDDIKPIPPLEAEENKFLQSDKTLNPVSSTGVGEIEHSPSLNSSIDEDKSKSPLPYSGLEDLTKST